MSTGVEFYCEAQRTLPRYLAMLAEYPWCCRPMRYSPMRYSLCHAARRPPAVSLEEGGILVPWVPGGPKQLRFYNTSMAELARFFSRSGPLQDGTHLSGRYDFVLNGLDNPDQLGPASAADPESRNPFADWDLAPLGLEVKRAKFPVSRLVIEHMDRPTPN